jgi:hypothetical protein
MIKPLFDLAVQVIPVFIKMTLILVLGLMLLSLFGWLIP